MRRTGPKVALLLLALLAMLVQTGSLQHLHAGKGTGFYNADHDLTLLAGLAAHGLPGNPPQLVVEPVSVPLTAVVLTQHPARLAQAAESRAPPRS
jgi:hypothetical protein